MSRPRIHENDGERRAAQNARRKVERKTRETEFVAVDGEGVSGAFVCDPSGDIWREHKYVLLGVADSQISDINGLGTETIFEFLYEQFLERPNAAFTGFYLGYDFTQWFKNLPEDRARFLLTEPAKSLRKRTRSGGNYTPFPVKYEGWEFDILGMKRFKLRPEGTRSWMYICDAGSFFQASLMSVIDPSKWADPVVTEEEYATLMEGKDKRSNAQLDADMRRYNVLENLVLARLMARLDQGFKEAGIRLKRNQWFGPGQAAQEWLGMQSGVPTSILLSERYGRDDRKSTYSNIAIGHSTSGELSILDVGRLTYYGGWFEIFAHGHVPGYSYEYDINSAYPAIIGSLPCLAHGEWGSGRGRPPGNSSGRYRIVHGILHGSNSRIGSGLHREPDGRICRPNETQGYYWQRELDAAIRAKLIDEIEYLEWWEYEPCNCPYPLRSIVGLYDKRLRVGKNTPAGKGYRLIYNSMYGKFAQSIGKPKYGNSIYASLITSGCREMILDAIATHPKGAMAVVMVATDGVYFTTSHPGLALSNKIGEWEETKHSNLTLFKPGVYWDDRARDSIRDGGSPVFKARGISAASFAKSIAEIDEQFSRWEGTYPSERDPAADREGWYPQIVFRSGFSMVTCQQALQWGKWSMAGRVGEAVLMQDADPVAKRHSGEYDEEHDIYWSAPYRQRTPFESTPYDKTFGQSVEDPEEYGITPDGTVLDAWKGMLR